MDSTEPTSWYGTGRPVHELSDAELETQGKSAHDTRNWVFLNGTAEQFATHTARMLELEQEYLRRHPKRTWQGSGGGVEPGSDADVVKKALRGIVAQLIALIEREPTVPSGTGTIALGPADALLARVVQVPEGKMHKLEVHQAAREVGLERPALARMYTADPPLLAADRDFRAITDAGRARLDSTQEGASEVGR